MERCTLQSKYVEVRLGILPHSRVWVGAFALRTIQWLVRDHFRQGQVQACTPPQERRTCQTPHPPPRTVEWDTQQQK